jgi:HEAT repeat protein
MLVAALESGAPKIRAVAAHALASVERERALPHLSRALRDPDPWVRYFAARSAGWHESQESAAALEQIARSDPAPHVRIAAIEALGKIDSRSAVALLARLAADGNWDISRVALQALGRSSAPEADDALLAAVRSGDPPKRLAAIHAAGGGRKRPMLVESLRWIAAADPDGAIAAAAIQALADMGAPESIAALVDLLAAVNTRERTIEALASVKDIDLVGEGLNHLDPSVRASVVEALARTRQPRASELLLRALVDESAMVRFAAARCFVHLSNRPAETKLAELAREDPDAGVREAAQRALRR